MIVLPADEMMHVLPMIWLLKTVIQGNPAPFPTNVSKSAEIIHRETGIPVSILDPGVTGPRDPAKARDSYIQAMEGNLRVLVKALKD